jgi:hypothetical protein
LKEEEMSAAAGNSFCFGLLFCFGVCGVCRLRLDSSQDVLERLEKAKLVIVA